MGATQTLHDFESLVENLKEQAVKLQDNTVSWALLKSFAVNLMYFSEHLATGYVEYKKSEALKDMKLSNKVLDLLVTAQAKYKNVAEIKAAQEFEHEVEDYNTKRMFYERAKILLSAYEKIFQVAYFEWKSVMVDTGRLNTWENLDLSSSTNENTHDYWTQGQNTPY